MSLRIHAGVLFLLSCLFVSNTQAVDLDWSQTTGPLFFYDTAGNWNPVQTPTDADNVSFSIPIAPTPNIIVGALSNGLNVNVLDNDWIFTGAGGANLDTEGTVTIDDVLGTTIADGTNLTVNAAVNWDTVLDLIVGDVGYGGMTLEADADFRGQDVFIGSQLGAVGEVNVDGAGSTLTADGNGAGNGVFIGNAGTGTLNITNGGFVHTTDAAGDISDFELGVTVDGEGTLNIDGADSNAEGEDVLIGNLGTGHLNITGGGLFNQNIGTTPDAFIAFDTNSSGDATVNGDGSQWLMRRLDVGRSSTGTLSVEAGGFVRAIEASNGNNGDVVLGTIADGDGKVAIFGSDVSPSKLDVDDNLLVGDVALGVLRVGQDLNGNADGFGELQVDVNLIIGDESTSMGENLVVVDGANANANVGNVTYVGNAGHGTLEVSGAANLTTRFLRVGQQAGSDGTLLVDGGSNLTATTSAGNTVIGTSGTGTATVSDGASLSTNQFWVGYQGAADGTLIVDNSLVLAGVGNSATDNDLIIGGRTDGSGGTGEVTVQNGGVLKSAVQTVIGGNATGSGSLTVTGTGSLFDNNDNGLGGASNDILRIGQGGAGTASVLAGGRIEAEGILIGHTNNNLAASLTVSGTDGVTPSTVETGGYLYVGNSRKGTMIVDQGAQVSIATNIATERIFIGDDNSADGSKLTISDIDSRLDYFGTGDVSVGNAGGANTGNLADRATLEVLAGGVFSAVQRNPDLSIASEARIIIGDLDNSNGRILVDGPGSLVEASQIYVGDGTNNSSGILDIRNGGAASTTGEVQIASNGNGVGDVFVDGLGSTLDVGGFLSLGSDLPNQGTATGTMLVTAGGAVSTAGQAFVGHYTGSTGSVSLASATANLSTWDVGGNLIVAGTESSSQLSGSGSLSVLTGGRLTADASLRIRNLGQVTLDGGEIRTNDLEFVDAGSDFLWTAGTLRFTSGPSYDLTQTILERTLDSTNPTLTANKHLAVDNTALLGTPLRLNGGTFSVGAISAASLANLDWDAGGLNITAQEVTVGAAGQLGASVVIDDDQTLSVPNNQLTVEAAADLNVIRGGLGTAHATNNGLMVISNTTAVDFDVDNNGSGLTNNDQLVAIDSTITGAVINNGTIEIVGAVNFTDGVSLTVSGSLGMDLDGPTSFDSISIGGDAALDGMLNVDVNGFALTAGDSFEIIDIGGVQSGQFSGLADGAVVGNFGGLDLFIDYDGGDGNDVVLFTDTGFSADFNNDGKVDVADLAQWEGDFGLNGMSDADGDNDSDGDDFLAWQQQLGSGVGGVATSQAIPEPSTGLLLLLTGLATTCLRSQPGRRHSAGCQNG